MTLTLILEQAFNGLQAGVTLFLVAAGLTLILGIMDVVFLAHGAQVMIGAYAAASLTSLTGNFFLGILLAIPITFASGFVLEYVLIRHLYRRDHMDQVLATFGLILFFNELIRIGFGPAALFSDLPDLLSGFVYILPDTPYPMFRLVVIFVGLACALGIHFLVSHTRIGAMVRAGAHKGGMAKGHHSAIAKHKIEPHGGHAKQHDPHRKIIPEGQVSHAGIDREQPETKQQHKQRAVAQHAINQDLQCVHHVTPLAKGVT